MEPTEQGKAALISGIEADARAEEEKLLQDAESQAAEKKRYAQKKAESLLKEARDRAEEQAAALRQKAVSSAEREVKRRALRLRDTLMRDIMERVEERLAAMIHEPDYRTVLADWMTEAAVGLGADAARINASAPELPLIDDQLLTEVRERIRAGNGKEMTLTLSEAEPLESQGVILPTVDGRMAFNNQVKTRMSRKRREIQMLVYHAVFAGKQEE